MNFIGSMRTNLVTLVLILVQSAAIAQTNLDSLRALWDDGTLADTVRFDALNGYVLSIRYTANPDTLLRNAELLTAFAEKHGLKVRMGKALNMEGNAYFDKGDYDRAQERYGRSAAIFAKEGDVRSEARSLNGLGNSFSVKGDVARAIELYMRSLRMAEQVKDSVMIARVLGNIGVSYYMQQDFEKALEFFHRRIEVADAVGDKQCASEAWGNIAVVHTEQGNPSRALEEYAMSMRLAEEVGNDGVVMRSLLNMGWLYIGMKDHAKGMELLTRSLSLAEAVGDSASIGVAFRHMGESYRDRGQLAEALSYAKLGLRIARATGDPAQVRESARLAYDIHKARKEYDEALRMHELFIAMRDSVANDENKQALMSQRFKYDYEKKEALLQAEQEKKDAIAAEELRRKNLQRNAFIGGFGLMILLAGTFLFQRNRIGKEKARSEQLLLNILPEEVAEELKAKGEAEAKLINEVTVLFTDFKGFTAMSEQLSPKELVHDLHECFSAFDHIMHKHGIEKIKTIGDAYMAAGGLPTPNTTHATDVIKAAFEMRDLIAEGKARKIAAGLPFFEVRIGVHTGPVVAGIVGVKKFSYDIWGDTVNTASRMESSGEVGQVNISEATYALVKDEPGLTFTPRGKVQAKGKGEMEMYFVSPGGRTV
jgi:adenylate cyclase